MDLQCPMKLQFALIWKEKIGKTLLFSFLLLRFFLPEINAIFIINTSMIEFITFDISFTFIDIIFCDMDMYIHIYSVYMDYRNVRIRLFIVKGQCKSIS